MDRHTFRTAPIRAAEQPCWMETASFPEPSAKPEGLTDTRIPTTSMDAPEKSAEQRQAPTATQTHDAVTPPVTQRRIARPSRPSALPVRRGAGRPSGRMLLLLFLPRPSPPPPAEGDGRFLARSRRLAAAASPRPCCRPLRPRTPASRRPSCPPHPPGPPPRLLVSTSPSRARPWRTSTRSTKRRRTRNGRWRSSSSSILPTRWWCAAPAMSPCKGRAGACALGAGVGGEGRPGRAGGRRGTGGGPGCGRRAGLVTAAGAAAAAPVPAWGQLGSPGARR